VKRLLFFAALFTLVQAAQATEKIWIPLGTPTGVTVPAVKSTPDAQGTPVWVAQATPQSTETPVIGVQVKDGHWTYTYPGGAPESEGDYAVGQKQGVWKYYRPDGSECREMEYKDGVWLGAALLAAPDGSQKYFEHLADLIQTAAPTEFKLKTLLPYWVDLLGDGDHQLLVIARSDHNSLVMVLDGEGHLLDSRVFDGFVDDMVFGEIRKGGPVCFGYDRTCDAGLGVCQWEFDVWDSTKIKPVLQYQGWYGKAGPFTLPVFREVDDHTQLVTDNGIYRWDEPQGMFQKIL
jgi:hypothetical protein